MESHLLELSSFDESTASIDSNDLVFLTHQMMDSEIMQTSEYVLQAEGFLQNLDQRTCKLIKGTNLEVKRILEAMIKHAPCDRGKRYAACAVVARCESGSRGIAAAKGLHALAHDWFKFLLLPFRMAYKSGSPPISEDSIVSAQQTDLQFEITKDGPNAFLAELKLRHQNKCAVFQTNSCFLNGAHIIKPSLVNGDKSNSAVPLSVPAIWDILRHYAGIDEDTFPNIGDLIDSPENGMMLELSMHRAFNEFHWYLESRGEPNEYEVKWLTKELHFFTLAGNRLIRFLDASGNNILLPRRRFIEIHAAMAQVLHTSGAGEYIDTMVDKFHPDSSVMPAGKFSSDDLDLRIFLTNLADHNFHHLPTSANEISIY